MEPEIFKRRAFLLWVIASAAGGGLGFIPSSVFGSYFDTMGYLFDDIQLPWPVGFQLIGVGVAIGFLQWLVLRRWVKQSFGWVIATAACWSLVFIGVNPNPFSRPVVLLVFGFLIGLFQWFVLRRWTRWAGWWIPFNAASWLIAFVVGELVSELLFVGFDVVFGSVMGGIAGAMTGLVLIWVVRPPSPDLAIAVSSSTL